MSIVAPVQVSASRLLRPSQSVLLIVDVQEKFKPVIPGFSQLLANIEILADTAVQLQIPVIVSEQYKKGLGETVSQLRDRLGESARYFEKTAFGCLGDQALLEYLTSLSRPQVLLCGLESHVCVSQSAHQLLSKGFQVHLISEAIGARTDENRRIGLEKMQQSGAAPSSVEMALFELLQDAAHPQFKAIQGLIK
ncbi:MAG: isochorismatase family protein [Vampirovibrionales bacterium]|nr:isochorismatase family protein [Vampirovibrionales bacterium]